MPRIERFEDIEAWKRARLITKKIYGNKEFINFLGIAKGSCGEARAQLYVALDQGFIDERDFAWACDNLRETSRMLSGLMSYLRESELKGRKYK